MISHLHSPILRAAFLGPVAAAFVSAQTPPAEPAAPAPAARLESLDATYASNLRKLHAPILAEYLAALEKLRQTLAAAGGGAAVQAEIDRVKQIGATSGRLPYDTLQAATETGGNSATPVPQPSPSPSPGAFSAPKNRPPANLVLGAATAMNAAPDPATLSTKPAGRALPLGTADWRVDRITAGSYRVAILYSCVSPPEGAVIEARLGGQSAKLALGAGHVTGNIDEFRVARLGTLRLEQDLTQANLQLRAPEPSQAVIWVRQVFLNRTGETEPAK